jgi:hypothetical protein
MLFAWVVVLTGYVIEGSEKPQGEVFEPGGGRPSSVSAWWMAGAATSLALGIALTVVLALIERRDSRLGASVSER